MKPEKLHISSAAKQHLTWFEIEHACNQHLGRKSAITSYHSTRAGLYYLVSDEDGRGVSIVLESENKHRTE